MHCPNPPPLKWRLNPLVLCNVLPLGEKGCWLVPNERRGPDPIKHLAPRFPKTFEGV